MPTKGCVKPFVGMNFVKNVRRRYFRHENGLKLVSTKFGGLFKLHKTLICSMSKIQSKIKEIKKSMWKFTNIIWRW